ncbi:hypothetical protein FHX06_005636 [Rhizobium sp. BK512]|nr:hypothetical protein [Rhizobium sp. BK512]
MIFSAAALGLKVIGFVSPAFHRRPGAQRTDARELVAVSLLLDQWCMQSAVNRSDPMAYATIARIVALRKSGKTIEEVWSEIASDAARGAENSDKGE